MRNDGLVYRGKAAKARLPDGEIKEYTPLVIRGGSCGLLIEARGDDAITEIVALSPRLILAYRAIAAIRVLECMDDTILPYIICLTEGGVPKQFKGREVDEEKYRQIMAIPIPVEIIDAIIAEGDLFEIEELDLEIFRGNIPWRPEFEKLGIEDPVKAAEKLKEERLLILKRLEKAFKDYKETLHLKDPDLISLIEDKMVKIAKEAKLPDEVIIASAGVGGFFIYRIKGEVFPMGISFIFSQLDQIQFLHESVDWLKRKTGENERECSFTVAEVLCKYA